MRSLISLCPLAVVDHIAHAKQKIEAEATSCRTKQHREQHILLGIPAAGLHGLRCRQQCAGCGELPFAAPQRITAGRVAGRGAPRARRSRCTWQVEAAAQVEGVGAANLAPQVGADAPGRRGHYSCRCTLESSPPPPQPTWRGSPLQGCASRPCPPSASSPGHTGDQGVQGRGGLKRTYWSSCVLPLVRLQLVQPPPRAQPGRRCTAAAELAAVPVAYHGHFCEVARSLRLGLKARLRQRRQAGRRVAHASTLSA